MRISFFGAAQEVTGSCYLVETSSVRFAVDCGLFQGAGDAVRKNRRPFDFDVSRLDFVLLTHAHLDHSGLLPKLVALGFKGPIFCTSATADLLVVMLKDAAYIQEREAEWRKHAGKRHQPLYTVKQAELANKQVQRTEYDRKISPHRGVQCIFRDAGHILGSSILEVWVDDGTRRRKLVFSGDIGQPGHPIVEDPAQVDSADVLLIESTYGNRLHKSMADTVEEFARAVTETIANNKGNVIVPAFAVGRTQDLLYLVVKLFREKHIPELDVYVDSPMAIAATEITLKHLKIADDDAIEAMRWIQGNRGRPRISFVDDHTESIKLSEIAHGALIISASGMCDAGRIKRHLRANLPRRDSSVIFTGFQAAGTLGRRIVDGSKSVRIYGEDVPVEARIFTIGGLSAHADRAALLDWLGHFHRPPEKTFVVHGEATTALDFADTIRQRFGWDVEVPARRDSYEI
ncbi:MAG: MBL fold metallo-hydrolase [Betaproteobacteria bacterium SG8_40]|nr:MAG: MBL fold metallo-hydrolase [Betaproteobacteria bacterium SG8_40]